jgi:redox-sensitive bicupin YhaK (pirin superfamily)
MTTLLKPRIHELAEGLEVRRLLPAWPTRMIGPFIFFDHFGPVTFPPDRGMDVRPHPHIGLATVSYLFAGSIMHRDSVGSVQRIDPGDVNWMTAGRGIVHSERSPEDSRTGKNLLHGVQTWVALPKAHEQADPSFSHHARSTLPLFERDGVSMRLLAGRAFGERAPTPTFSDMFYLACEMGAGAIAEIPPEHAERGVYLAEGDAELDGEALPLHHAAVLPAGATVRICARGDTRLVLFGGEKMDGDRFIWWNFVASSRELIEAAKERWREQRFEHIEGETEFIPLPP